MSPPQIIIQTDFGQLRDILGRFRFANSRLQDWQMEHLTTEGERLLTIVKREAPRRSGEFAEAHALRVRQGSKRVEIVAPEPLATFVIGGTVGGKRIYPKNAQALSFFWEKVGEYVIFSSVMRKTIPPNPYNRRAWNQWLPGAEVELNRVSLNWWSGVSQ